MDGGPAIWPLGAGAEDGPRRLPIPERAWSGGFYMAPGRDRVAAWSERGEVCVWKRASWRQIACRKHPGAVADAVVSPSGARIAVWGPDNVVHLWSAAEPERAASLLPHDLAEGRIRGLAFDRQEGRAITWGDSYEARVWALEDRARPLHTLRHAAQGIGRGVRQGLFSPQGALIVTASQETVHVWNAGTAARLHRLEHDDRVKGAGMSDDGERLLSWDEAGNVRLWDARSGQPLAAPFRHQGAVNGAAFYCHDDWVLTWSADGTAALWDPKGQARVEPPARRGTAVSSAELHCGPRAGNRFLTRDAGGAVRVWASAGVRHPERRLQSEYPVQEAALRGDGPDLVIVDVAQRPLAWQGGDWRPLLDGLAHPVLSRLSADHSRILTVTRDGVAQAWEAADGTLVTQSPIRVPARRAKRRFPVLSHDGRRVLSLDEGGSPAVWTAAGEKAFHLIPERPGVDFLGAVFSPDGRTLFTWSAGREARLWDGEGGAPLLAEPLRPEARAHVFLAAAYSADGARLAAWSDGGAVHVADTVRGERIGDILYHGDTIGGAVFSRDGRAIATWVGDLLRYWEIASARERFSPLPHGGKVSGAAFDQGNTRILTWTRSNEARLWGARSGKSLAVLRHDPLDPGIEGAAFAGTGDTEIVTWGGSGSIRVWSLAPGQEPVAATPSLALARRSGTGLDDVGALEVYDRAAWKALSTPEAAGDASAGGSWPDDFRRWWDRVAGLLPAGPDAN